MKKLRRLTLVILGALLLSACAAASPDKPEINHLTAEETANLLMGSLKSLNLDLFNEYSDNYVSTERNWLGVPVRKEYQVFSELLQPFPGNRKRYQTNFQFSQKLMENLAWEITEVREIGSQAEIDMEITNIDMMKAMGHFEISLLENMMAGDKNGLFQLAGDISGLIHSAASLEGLSLAMDQLDKNDLSTINVTLLAFQENGIWKIQLNDDFINAFMGNINSGDYPIEIEKKIEELTLQYEEKADRMAEQFEQKILEGFSD